MKFFLKRLGRELIFGFDKFEIPLYFFHFLNFSQFFTNQFSGESSTLLVIFSKLNYNFPDIGDCFSRTELDKFEWSHFVWLLWALVCVLPETWNCVWNWSHFWSDWVNYKVESLFEIFVKKILEKETLCLLFYFFDMVQLKTNKSHNLISHSVVFLCELVSGFWKNYLVQIFFKSWKTMSIMD